MSKADSDSRTAVAVLKWVGGIAAAVVGTLIVIVIITTATTVNANATRLTKVEARNEARDASILRIETDVNRLVDVLITQRAKPR